MHLPFRRRSYRTGKPCKWTAKSEGCKRYSFRRILPEVSVMTGPLKAEIRTLTAVPYDEA